MFVLEMWWRQIPSNFAAGKEGGGGVKGKAWHIIQAFGSYSNTTILSYEFKMHSVLALRFRGINQKTGTLLQQIYRED